MEKKLQKNRIAKNTLFLYFRMLFLMVISLFTSRVVLQALGVQDYGIYNVVGGFVSMFSLISASLTSACTRFLNFELGVSNPNRINVVFSTSVTIQYILSAIIILLCESIGLWYLNHIMVIPENRLIAANFCYQFSIINFCMNLITIPYNAAIVAHEKMKVFAYISILEGISKFVICYVIMISPYDRLILYALLLVVIQIIIRIIYQWYCWHSFTECKYKFILDRDLMKRMFSYSGWHIIGNSAGILKVYGVNVILNLFFGPAINAAKGISNQVLHAVQGFSSNFIIAVNPQITQSYAHGDIQYMLNLVYKGSLYSFYLLYLISLPIIINADFLIGIWLENVPAYTVCFSQLTLIVALISSLSNTLVTAQNATGNVRLYQLVVGGIQLLNLPICYIFLKIGCNPVSVIFVAIFIEILSLIARILIIPRFIKEFKFSSFVNSVLKKVLFVTTISFTIPLGIYYFANQIFQSGIVNILITLLWCAFTIFAIGLDKNERKFCIGKLRCIKNKQIGIR